MVPTRNLKGSGHHPQPATDESNRLCDVQQDRRSNEADGPVAVTRQCVPRARDLERVQASACALSRGHGRADRRSGDVARSRRVARCSARRARARQSPTRPHGPSLLRHARHQLRHDAGSFTDFELNGLDRSQACLCMIGFDNVRHARRADRG